MGSEHPSALFPLPSLLPSGVRQNLTHLSARGLFLNSYEPFWELTVFVFPEAISRKCMTQEQLSCVAVLVLFNAFYCQTAQRTLHTGSSPG